MNKMKKQKGQTLLVIVLIMAVLLTVGLAVVSRSITDIQISRQEEESAIVFSAAEAGIEEALKRGSASGPHKVSTKLGEITTTVTETPLGGGTKFIFPGGGVVAGQTQTLWLVGHDADGNLAPSVYYRGNQLQVHWGNANVGIGDTTPAIEISLIYEEGGLFKVARWTGDPFTTRTPPNKFDLPDIGSFPIGGTTFRFRKTIGLPVGAGIVPYALRMKFFYSQPVVRHSLGVLAVGVGNDLPKAGKCYQATANYQGNTRRVEQCQFYKAPPGIFDYVLYSATDLVKK